jgi:hypothetical protein
MNKWIKYALIAYVVYQVAAPLLIAAALKHDAQSSPGVQPDFSGAM